MSWNLLPLGLGIVVSVVCLTPVVLTFMPLDGDYSDTVEVTYEVGGHDVVIEVPAEDTAIMLRHMPDVYISKTVMADDPAVKAVADCIMASFVTDVERAEVALDMVSSQIEYITDVEAHGRNDYWQLPYETLRLGTGDCEDQAILLVSILTAMGIDSIFVYQPGHVSAAVAVEGDGYTVDCNGVTYLTADPTGHLGLGAYEAVVEGTAGSSMDWSVWWIPAVLIVVYVVTITLFVWVARS